MLAEDLVDLVRTFDDQLGESLAFLAAGELQDALVVLRVRHPDLVATLVRVRRLRSPRRGGACSFFAPGGRIEGALDVDHVAASLDRGGSLRDLLPVLAQALYLPAALHQEVLVVVQAVEAPNEGPRGAHFACDASTVALPPCFHPEEADRGLYGLGLLDGVEVEVGAAEHRNVLVPVVQGAPALVDDLHERGVLEDLYPLLHLRLACLLRFGLWPSEAGAEVHQVQIGDRTKHELDLLSCHFHLHERLQNRVLELLVALVSDHDHHPDVEVLEHLASTRGAALLPGPQVLGVDHADVRHVEIHRVVALVAGAELVLSAPTLLVRDEHVARVYDPGLFDLIPLPGSRPAALPRCLALSVRMDRQ